VGCRLTGLASSGPSVMRSVTRPAAASSTRRCRGGGAGSPAGRPRPSRASPPAARRRRTRPRSGSRSD
jgi:hypothetical protein